MFEPPSLNPEVVVSHTSLLGEGPVWDGNSQSIWWVDIFQGRVHQFNVPQRQHRQFNVGEMVSMVALCKNGKLLAALQSGLVLVDPETGEIKKLHDPEPHLPDNRFNDGKCDPAGRLWLGTMSLSGERGAGTVYLCDKDLGFSKKIENVTCPNGIAWDVNRKVFYFIDTPAFEVAAYNYDEQTGSITERRVAIKIPPEYGHPDGMTIDTDGMLWIAHWGGWQVTRWDPDTSRKSLSISLPVALVTSCTFGGADLHDLYITSAKTGLTTEQLELQPLAGSLFVVRNCGFNGFPAVEFEFESTCEPSK